MKPNTCNTRMQFVESESADSKIGVRFRKARPGPELDLIESFLKAMPLTIPEGCRATIFRELRLESGVPDIVIVVWREEVTHAWRSERISLNTHDLRLMHFLHYHRSVKEDKLVTYFGKRTTESIGRLYDAGMIRPTTSSAWVPLALRQSFAATKIIAVEAKVGKWKEVLNQAILNTWFASKSYVLIPRLPSQRQLVDAQKHGIGVCSLNGKKVREVSSVSTRLPRSYASWMLNDWAWRSAQTMGDYAE